MLDLADPSVSCATWIVNLESGISCVAAILEHAKCCRAFAGAWNCLGIAGILSPTHNTDFLSTIRIFKGRVEQCQSVFLYCLIFFLYSRTSTAHICSAACFFKGKGLRDSSPALTIQIFSPQSATVKKYRNKEKKQFWCQSILVFFILLLESSHPRGRK